MERHDVVIVGAGLAGLAAADRLIAAGVDAVVVEARERVGGRVLSHRFADGQFCERGAEFVDSTHREVLALAARLGLRLLDATVGVAGDRRLDLAGRAVALADLPSVVAEHSRWEEAVSAIAGMVDADDPLGGAAAADLDSRSAGELIASLDLSAAARVLIGRELRTELMVPPAEVSQLHLAWIAAGHRQAGEGREAFRIDGGADSLATGLAAGFVDRIRLGCPVRAIDARAGTVVVGADEGDVDRLAADRVVVTVPPPVLARIDVDPPLPVEVVGIGIGVGGKVSTQYERRVWRDHGSDGRVASDRAVGELWETTVGQPGDRGVLTALLSSHDGAALASLPDAGERVRREVVRLFPGAVGLALDTITTDWTNDPWSLGCYAAFAPGQLTSCWSSVRRPHGRLLLAGEHTDTMAGYMEGALRSGQRVAAAILDGG